MQNATALLEGIREAVASDHETFMDMRARKSVVDSQLECITASVISLRGILDDADCKAAITTIEKKMMALRDEKVALDERIASTEASVRKLKTALVNMTKCITEPLPASLAVDGVAAANTVYDFDGNFNRHGQPTANDSVVQLSGGFMMLMDDATVPKNPKGLPEMRFPYTKQPTMGAGEDAESPVQAAPGAQDWPPPSDRRNAARATQ